jgi:hypothetical protein
VSLHDQVLVERRPVALPGARVLWRAGLAAALAVWTVLVVVLATYQLDAYPTTWFDEGSHLHVPKSLVQNGVYADSSSEGFRYFGPTTGIGPTIMLPIAAVFQVFGIDLLPARLVIVAYLLGGLLAFVVAARRLYGSAVAILAALLLVSSPGIDLLYFGRQVLGEVPAFAFLMLGIVAWLSATDRQGVCTRRLLLASLAFGLVALTKNQFSLILAPTFIVAGLLDRFYHRRVGLRAYALPFLGVCCGIGLGLIAQFLPALASQDFGQTLAAYRNASAGAIFVFSPARIASSLKFLASPEVFGYWGLPAVAYALLLASQRSLRGAQQALLATFVVLGLAWFALGSIGWPRYAFPALTVTAIFAAKLLVDLITRLARTGGPTVALAGRQVAPAMLASIGLVVLLIGSPLMGQAQKVLATADRSPRAVAAYLETNVPRTAVIETWEPELGFLTDHAYHYPPTGWLDRAVRAQWLGSTMLRTDYDPVREANPEYLVVGRFGKYTAIYQPFIASLGSRPIATFGEYDVYRVR